jgi:hypothetical protein
MNPFHHQTQISSAAPLKSKTSNTNNLQANKNNQKHKKTTQIKLLTSTTFHDAQPSCSLAPSTSLSSCFRVFTFHPFTSTHTHTHTQTWHYFNITNYTFSCKRSYWNSRPLANGWKMFLWTKRIQLMALMFGDAYTVFINIFNDLHVHDIKGCVPSWNTFFMDN